MAFVRKSFSSGILFVDCSFEDPVTTIISTTGKCTFIEHNLSNKGGYH